MIFIDPKEPIEKEVNGTTFLINVLTSRQMARLAAGQTRLHSEDGAFSNDHIDHYELVLRQGLAGWKDGPEFKTDEDGRMSEGTLDLVPFGEWVAIYAAILEVNTVTEEDAKN